MSFQIRTSTGHPVPMRELDEEAATLWGKEVHRREYAYPQIPPEKFESFKEEFNFYSAITNWFDKIGWQIHIGKDNWDDIRAIILDPFKEYPEEEVLAYPAIDGYIKLVDFWKAKGYVPVPISE